jgi:hypothetical protein
MSIRAEGTFEVNATSEPPYESSDGVTLARTTITKKFRGDLDATSTVQMLGVNTPVPGSAGYVAIERVVGRLFGRNGTFVFQHHGWMQSGEIHLTVTVVPDSGTGEFRGLSGKMTIRVVEGQHYYTFEHLIAREE